MSCLSCISTTKVVAFASLPDSAPPPASTPQLPITNPTRRRRRRNNQQNPPLQRKPQEPSIVQIERAIGAGSYRDAEPGDLGRRNTIFDGLLPSGGGKFEGSIEKKLRETGEWISNETEAGFRSSGKRILMVVIQWILPIWTLSLLVAAGVIKLPFSTPLLDDLIM